MNMSSSVRDNVSNNSWDCKKNISCITCAHLQSLKRKMLVVKNVFTNVSIERQLLEIIGESNNESARNSESNDRKICSHVLARDRLARFCEECNFV